MVSDSPAARFSLGYADGTMISVPTNADDVRVEVTMRPGGPLKVQTAATRLLQTNQTQVTHELSH
jgi:hypothetical protein